MSIEGKKYTELLGIDKPREWLENQSNTCRDAVVRDAIILGNMTQQYFEEGGQPNISAALEAMGIGHPVMGLAKLYYYIGFMRGRIIQEHVEKLDAMWQERGEE